MKNRQSQLLKVAFALSALAVAGCKVSVGDGHFDSGLDFDADVTTTGGSATGGSDMSTGGTSNTGGSDVATDASMNDMDSAVGSDASTTTGTIADVPAALAAALCDAREACVGPARLAALYDGNTCADVVAAELEDGSMSQIEVSVTASVLIYDDSVLDDCLSDVRAQGCAVSESRLPAKCREALLGIVATGDDCNTDFDCEGDAFCDFGSPQPSCPGACAARGAADAPCTEDNQCQDGLLCTPAGTCQAPVATSGDCDGDSKICGLQDICVAGTGTCMSQDVVYAQTENADCTPDTGTLCLSDINQGISLVCAADSKTCVPVSLANEACVPGSIPDACPINQYCHPTQEVCVERETAGRACTGRAKECAAGLTCLNDACERIGRLGDACDSDWACYSYHCNLVSGMCEAPVVCQ